MRGGCCLKTGSHNDIIHLRRLLKSIEDNSDLDNSLNQLVKFEIPVILEAITNEIKKQVAFLNFLARLYSEKGKWNEAFLYLSKAFEIKNNDTETVFNLAAVSGTLGETSLAKYYYDYFKLINKKQTEVLQLLLELKNDDRLDNLLKLLAISAHEDQKIQQVIFFLMQDTALTEDVGEIVSLVYRDKIKFLNKLGKECARRNLHRCGISLFQKALENVSDNKETIKNWGAVLEGLNKTLAKQLRPAENTSYPQNIETGSENRRKRFVTLFPETKNAHLTKDVGIIPFIMQKYYGFDSILACYKNGSYPHLHKEVKGLNIDFIGKITENPIEDGKIYLTKNAHSIDVLQLFHLDKRSLLWIDTYKSLNPNGKVYLKLDADIDIRNATLDNQLINILDRCDLISVETRYLYWYLNEVWPLRHKNPNRKWPLSIEYIPNGFYDYGVKAAVNYEEKENFICTVGRIGSVAKANEILLEAFKIAAPHLPGWKLKIIGSIEPEFNNYINCFFAENPELKDRVTFTGEITDKEMLDEQYKKAKVFCLTSRFEGFPLVLPEAAKNGCFIISSNLLPAADITDNKKYGDIYEIDNIGQLADSLIRNCRDEVLKDRCKAIQEFAYENFYWVDICKNIVKHLL